MRLAKVPGLALALIQDGQIAHRRAYGLADVEKQRPLATDTVMYGASLTKAAFAYMTLQLVGEGVIDLGHWSAMVRSRSTTRRLPPATVLPTAPTPFSWGTPITTT